MSPRRWWSRFVAAPVDAELQVPDYLEPVIAWRAWWVARDEGDWQLRSVIYKCSWIAGRALRAECLTSVPARGVAAPQPGCSCGVYGASRAARAVDYAYDHLGDRPGMRVLGTVALWGRVIECQEGWRAEYAYPDRIYVPLDGRLARRQQRELVEGLHAYGVPVEVLPADGRTEVLVSLAARAPIVVPRQHAA